MRQVAFLGLGNMGEQMARNLLSASNALTVWNRTSARAAALERAGARVAASVPDAVRDADLVITMLADDAAVEQTVWSAGMLTTMRSGALHVSMSTISVALADRLTAGHDAAGSRFVAAPVFGRPEAAAAAKLFVVAAGEQAALDAAQPVFDAVAQRTFRVHSRPSAANVIKLSGNFLVASMIESLGEAFAFVRKHDLDPAAYLELLTGTLFDAPVYRTYGTLIAEGRYQPAGFALPLGLKDVGLVLDAARSARVPMPTASLVADRMIAALAQGHEKDDWSSIAGLAARNAGLPDQRRRTPERG